MKSQIYSIICAALLAMLASCGTPTNLVYVQDLIENYPLTVQEPQPIKLAPGDQLSISVFARDKELTPMFNLGGGTGGSTSSGSHYTVDAMGQIDFPILGLINVRGLTRQEVAYTIKQRLLASRMIKDPIVTVEYYNMGFSVLGEVGSPGWQAFGQDVTTLLEAIALCGDLTINGLRENVLVLRTIDGKQIPYRVDLTNVQSVYSSPVYYLRQGDMVYVEPNGKKLDQASYNAASMHTPTFWISMVTVAMTLGLFFVK